MQGDLLIPVSLLVGFLLVLVRVSGVFVFIPMPGAGTGPVSARVVLALVATFALSPFWPVPAEVPGVGLLLKWILAEAAMGVLAGVLFSFIAEALVLGAQILSLQAGYAYASSIDPTTQADSGILLIFAQLMAGLLFFTMGLDRQVIAAFAASLQTFPPGTFEPTRPMAEHVWRFGAGVFSLACRIALPVVLLLFMIDIALGILGRISVQLQTGLLSFPLKMMFCLLMLAMMAPIFPLLYGSHAAHVLEGLRAVIAPR